jgi:hypothetical protein
MPGLTKITSGEMREQGIRGILVYCADYRCSHSVAVSADQWPDNLRKPHAPKSTKGLSWA